MSDLTVIGAGPGGYVAAIAAARAGFSCTLIEREHLGGTCLNWGCIPTKAMIADARLCLKASKHTDLLGIEKVRPDLLKIQQRKTMVVDNLRKGIEQLIKGHKVNLIRGEARIDNQKVSVLTADGTVSVESRHVIIATGSKSRDLPFLKRDGKQIYDSSDMLNLKEIPESLGIIGGGVIGLEFAHLYASLGARVTVLEAMPQILPGADSQMVRRLAMALKKQNIEIRTGVKISEASSTGQIVLTLENGEKLAFQKVLLSVGRIPELSVLQNSSDFELVRGRIKIDCNFQTSVPGFYAIGDAVSEMMLAHVASAQAEHLIEHLSGKKPSESCEVPACVFSSLDYAFIGKTEDQLKESGFPYRSGTFNYPASSMACALGETEGMAKILTDHTGKILGAHFIGEGASDLVHEAAVAIRTGMTSMDIAALIHAHPTLSEIVKEACADSFGGMIHKIYR